MALIFPERWIKQPQGPVEVDWSHPLSRGLVFFQIPSQAGAPDLVSGNTPTIVGACTMRAGKDGVGLATGSISSGWGTTATQTLFDSITTEFTVATRTDISELTSNSKTLCIPWHDSTWSAPWPALAIGRYTTSSRFVIEIAIGPNSGDRRRAEFPEDTIALGDTNYVAIRNGADASLLRNGIKYAPTVNLPFGVDSGKWGPARHVNLMVRNVKTTGEGTVGTCYYVAIWNRPLSDDEALSFTRAPYQLLRPLKRKLYFDSFSAPVGEHVISGGVSLPNPAISGNVSQGSIPPHAVSGGVSLPKPAIYGSVTQGVIAPHAIAGGISLPKPAIAGLVSLGVISPHVLTGGVSLQKPTASGGISQGSISPHEILGGVTLPRPAIAATMSQGSIPPHVISGGISLPKPSVSGSVAQGALGSHSLSGGLSLPKPTVLGNISQGSIPPHAVLGGISLPKPSVFGGIAQGSIGAQTISGGLSLTKPIVSGSIAQTFPTRIISGGLRLLNPKISGVIAQSALSPSIVSGGVSLTRPTIKGLIYTPSEYKFPVGIKLASGGQLSLADGHLLLLALDPEGNYEVVHPIAIAQRTVEAGYGANPLTFEGPLDPAELKYFTVTWDTELQAATDSIVPDNGTIEGQSVFLTLSGAAVSAGLQVHAFSQDGRSVTFWLKVDPAQKNRTEWNGSGELHLITIRIITIRGQVFERDISFRVKQL